MTTAEPNVNFGEEGKINKLLSDILEKHGCEIILNGLMRTIKYYLRLISNPSEFIQKYTENLQIEFGKSTEIKAVHLEAWKAIVKVNFS